MTKRPINTVRPRPAKTALTLPGDKLLCVRAGFESRAFDYHTKHIFVERRPAVQQKIIRETRKLSCEWDPRFWRGDLHKLPLRAALGNEPLEFAYLDLCAALNGSVAWWVYTELAPALQQGAVLAVTLSRNWRRSNYMSWWARAVRRANSTAAAEFQRINRAVYSADCAGGVGDMLDYYDDSAILFEDSYMLPARGISRWNRRLRPEYHDASVKIISAFTALLPYHDFRLEACVEYRRSHQATNGHSMTTFVLTNLTPRTETRFPPAFLTNLNKQMESTLRPIALARRG